MTFTGSFFHVADFIHGLDSLVKTKNAEVEVTGRLITINDFSLTEDGGKGFPLPGSELHRDHLPRSPGTGSHRRAPRPTSPEPSTSTQVSTTTGGTP